MFMGGGGEGVDGSLVRGIHGSASCWDDSMEGPAHVRDGSMSLVPFFASLAKLSRVVAIVVVAVVVMVVVVFVLCRFCCVCCFVVLFLSFG